MASVARSCARCSSGFAIDEWDSRCYERIDVPPPTLCPPCREQRRTAQINQIHLFRRRCDATGENIITNYPPESPLLVYAQPYWFSDAWDATTYGQSFDFGRPFFDQYQRLAERVPRPALLTDYLRDENSAYTNYAGLNKNCYLIFDSDESWDCYYSYGMNSSRSSLECYRVSNVELCYEALDSQRCYNCAFIANCDGCFDSAFLSNCIGCRNCFCCSNQQHKENYVQNHPSTAEEVRRLRAELATAWAVERRVEEFEAFRLQFPQKAIRGFHNEGVSGNYLTHCRNANLCFDCRDLWDAKYCYQSFMKGKDFMDIDECGDGEILYECTNLGYNAYFIRFSLQCLSQITNLTYCNLCFNGSSDLFGCVGMQRKKFCILNKQYTRAEYEEILPRIVAHMRETGEWGEFFPVSTSAFPYNLTLAHEHYPLSREEALAQGFTWRDPVAQEKLVPTAEVPERIVDATDSLSQQIVGCASCGRGFRIIAAELQLYRKLALALPRFCFECRHRRRFAKRAPRKLWTRSCCRCGIELSCAYPLDSPEQVACEMCWLDSLQ